MTSANFFGAAPGALDESAFEPLCASAEKKQKNNNAPTLAQSSVRLITFLIRSIGFLHRFVVPPLGGTTNCASHCFRASSLTLLFVQLLFARFDGSFSAIKSTGSMSVPAHLTWRCRCGPEALPVLPLLPIVCPALTTSPTFTSIFERWR